ncbi:P-loop containing nucleoside triphosphate hydrolase protein [Scleroderma yunnanense]
MGPTGAGKSSFISQVTGQVDGVGHKLTSCTSDIGVTRCMILGSPVVLVDTPGFDDTNKPDLQILEMISDWLAKTYQKQVFLSSILFFHRITDNRMAGTPLKNLRVFQKLCGNKAMSRVVLVTTMWDEIEPEIGQERLKELTGSYWRTMIAKGSQTFEHQNHRESAERLLEIVVRDKGDRERVALQQEIADLKMKIPETGAGQELCSSLEQLAERRLEVLRKIRAESKDVKDQQSERDLRKEYAELRAQLDATLSQVQALKLSMTQRAFALIRRTLPWKGLGLPKRGHQ